MKLKKIAGMLLCLCLVFSVMTPTTVMASDDTDGTEIKVIEPEALEIQLGPEWGGVEFQLKTDAGLYPNPIPVGTDGFLRLEIGGSSKYILSCLNSSVALPEPEKSTVPSESTEKTDSGETETDNIVNPTDGPIDNTDSAENTMGTEESTVFGIPVKHVVLFGMIMLIAVVVFTAWILNRRNQSDGDDNSEYWDDEDF